MTIARSIEANPIKDKLVGLYTLQLIDSKTDEIRILRGELPIEVEDLEDEITGLEKRVGKIKKEIADIGRQTPIRKSRNGPCRLSYHFAWYSSTMWWSVKLR